MSNRSIKKVLSTRLSFTASELLNILREDSGKSVSILIEEALLSIASDVQKAAAVERAAESEKQSRIAKAAKAIQKLSDQAEVQEAVERAKR